MQKDEENVRAACAYLIDKVIPDLVCVSFALLYLQMSIFMAYYRLRILKRGMLGPQWMGTPFLV